MLDTILTSTTGMTYPDKCTYRAYHFNCFGAYYKFVLYAHKQ